MESGGISLRGLTLNYFQNLSRAWVYLRGSGGMVPMFSSLEAASPLLFLLEKEIKTLKISQLYISTSYHSNFVFTINQGRLTAFFEPPKLCSQLGV